MADDTRIGVRALRENLADTLRQVGEGKSFTVVSRDKPVARLVPAPVQATGWRIPGLLKGQIHYAPDWQETPEWMIDLMEGNGA